MLGRGAASHVQVLSSTAGNGKGLRGGILFSRTNKYALSAICCLPSLPPNRPICGTFGERQVDTGKHRQLELVSHGLEMDALRGNTTRDSTYSSPTSYGVDLPKGAWEVPTQVVPRGMRKETNYYCTPGGTSRRHLQRGARVRCGGIRQPPDLIYYRHEMSGGQSKDCFGDGVVLVRVVTIDSAIINSVKFASNYQLITYHSTLYPVLHRA